MALVDLAEALPVDVRRLNVRGRDVAVEAEGWGGSGVGLSAAGLGRLGQNGHRLTEGSGWAVRDRAKDSSSRWKLDRRSRRVGVVGWREWAKVSCLVDRRWHGI